MNVETAKTTIETCFFRCQNSKNLQELTVGKYKKQIKRPEFRNNLVYDTKETQGEKMRLSNTKKSSTRKITKIRPQPCIKIRSAGLEKAFSRFQKSQN